MKRLHLSSTSDTSDEDSESDLNPQPLIGFYISIVFKSKIKTHFCFCAKAPSTSFCSSHKYGSKPESASTSHLKKPAEVSRGCEHLS